MSAAYIPDNKLPGNTCLPPKSTAITAIDITPNGCTFAPAALLHYFLPQPPPATVTYYSGKSLFIYQNTGGICPNAWSSVSTGPATILNTLTFADGNFNHTSLFVLVDLQGVFNAMGTLVQAFQQVDPQTISFVMDVSGSSTNPELNGKTVTVELVGVKTDRSVEWLKDAIPKGSTILLHHEQPQGMLWLWSGPLKAQMMVDIVKVSP